MKEKQAEKQAKARKADFAKLQEELESLQKEKDELFGKLQRVSADYVNYQKRAPKQIADTIAYEKERIIKTLLPALDNFEHMLQNALTAESRDVLMKGIEIVYDQMIDILKSHGVEQIIAVGEEFNPALHEAMMRQTEPDEQENIILAEFQKGYKVNGRVIRPSKVIVNKLGPEKESDLKEETEQEQAAEECEGPDEE